MSKLTHSARADRREEQLIKDVVRRRPLFSAFSVLVGTGAVALSTLPSQAHARSALDDMAWAPQEHARLSQEPPVARAAKAMLNQAVSISSALAQEKSSQTYAVSTPLPSATSVAPRIDSTSAATSADTARTPGHSESIALNAPPERRVNAVPLQPRPRGFADAGLMPVNDSVSSTTGANVPGEVQAAQAPQSAQAPQPAVLTAGEAATAAVSVRREPVRGMVMPVAMHAAQPTPLGLSESPIRPALATKRAVDMQADIISLRRGIDPGSLNRTNGDAGSSMPSVQADSLVRRGMASARKGEANLPGAVAVAAGGTTQSNVRRARGAEDNYADWLDDGRGGKSLANTAIVPEQAVRAALRNAADAAAARSPALKQARNDWDAAKFDIDQVKGQRYPQIQVGANSPAITGDTASFNQYNRPTASVAITTLIYDFGKTSKSIDSRTKTAEATEFYYQAMAQQNAYETSSSLVELTKFRAVYAIGENYVKRMSQLVQMLEEIVKVDPGRLSELTQAKSRLLQAQTSQETIAAQARTQEIAVRKLVGDEPTPMPAGTHWQFMLDGVDSAVTAVTQNPAIAQADAEAAAAKLTAQSVKAESMPKLNWVINKNTASDVFGNRQPWSTMLQLS